MAGTCVAAAFVEGESAGVTGIGVETNAGVTVLAGEVFGEIHELCGYSSVLKRRVNAQPVYYERTAAGIAPVEPGILRGLLFIETYCRCTEAVEPACE